VSTVLELLILEQVYQCKVRRSNRDKEKFYQFALSIRIETRKILSIRIETRKKYQARVQQLRTFVPKLIFFVSEANANLSGKR